MKRELDIVVLSDVHLGTYGCHAGELLQYLKSIKVGTLILNGDFIDIWQFRKRYFPREHLQVIQRIMKMSAKGTKVYYITGNHDDLLRRYTDFSAGNIHLRDKLILHLNQQKYWIFHGDVFDLTIQYSPHIARLGGRGYDLLIRINRVINNIRAAFGRPRMSFAKRVKNRVKEAVRFIADFEQTAIRLAREEGFDYVICGHIHRPEIRTVQGEGPSVTYLNSGDWVENLTALEYFGGRWNLYEYDPADYGALSPRLQVGGMEDPDEEDRTDRISPDELLRQIMNRNEKITLLGG